MVRGFERLRISQNRFLTDSTALNLYFFFVYAVRTVYGLFVIDPHSGQDAPSYYEDAEIVLREGPLAQVSYAPIWPIGYTWFMALIWRIGGLDSRLLGFVQSTLVLIATFALYQLVKREINKQVAMISTVLVTSSFAIFVSSGEIMYETPMMSLFLIGLNYISKFSLDEIHSRKSALLGGVFLAFSTLIHPSILGPVAISLVVILGRLIKKRNQLTSWALLALIVLSAPAINTMRNYVSGDGLGYTGNIYTISTFSGWGSQDPDQLKICNDKGVKITSKALIDKAWHYDSTPRQLCLYKIALDHPTDSVEIAIRNGIRWVSPYIGVLKSNGTWYHGLDARRLIPGYQWWEGKDRVLDTVLCSLWIVMHVSLMLFGSLLLWRKRDSLQAKDYFTPYLFILPVFTKWATSIFTHGDSRHRLGVSPLYLTLVSVSIYYFWTKSQANHLKKSLN
jgi:hypothetical protein